VTEGGGGGTHGIRRRGLEESRAGTLLALSTLLPAVASVSHDMLHATSWLRDSILRPEASTLPPDPHTAPMLRPETVAARWGGGAKAGDIARRESRRVAWVDPTLQLP
jgi:hypothetical protein